MTTDNIMLLAFLETAITFGADKVYLTNNEFNSIKDAYQFLAYFARNTGEAYNLTGGCYGRYKELHIYNDEATK
jgi:hypothetical protein